MIQILSKNDAKLKLMSMAQYINDQDSAQCMVITWKYGETYACCKKDLKYNWT